MAQLFRSLPGAEKGRGQDTIDDEVQYLSLDYGRFLTGKGGQRRKERQEGEREERKGDKGNRQAVVTLFECCYASM